MLRRVIGNLLVSAGSAIVVVVVGLAAYNAFQEYSIKQAYATGSESTSTTVAETPVAGPSPARGETEAAPAGSPARWLAIPAIGVDTPVVEAKLVDGQWQVPKFVAGHLEGTAQPGEGRNVALSGHVQSISSGNVFADLARLKPGDTATVRTADGRTIRYVVSKVVEVKNNDLSVVQPGNEEALTLITCSGEWDPVARDYTNRTVAIAHVAP